MKYIKPLALTIFICFLGAMILIFSSRSASRQTAHRPLYPKPKAITMTIFVHGTFSPLLGLLSFTNVMSDNLKNTLYRKINKKMRDDCYFYQDQPMLKRGLHLITPTFSLPSLTNGKCAAYPITKAYHVLEELVEIDRPTRYFYTFGWSGLMSQNKRRLDALRFYNCLLEEVQRLKQLHNHSTISIRLIAHSHGGNVCLNLAAIHEIIKHKGVPPLLVHPEKQESVEKMFDIIKEMPNKNVAKIKNGSHDVDYVPDQLLPYIKELVLYGTPIQPETECFFSSDIFENIYHFYSQQDIIQQLDWVTTKQNFSKQRISNNILKTASKKRKIIQCRITHDHLPLPASSQTSTFFKKTSSQENQIEESIWSKLFSKSSPLYQTSRDPSHKEFWFLPWRKEKNEKESALWPLPSVIFTPVFIALLKELTNTSDVNLNISAINNAITFSVLDYNGTLPHHSASLAHALVQEIKDQIALWKPDNFTEKSSFKAIYSHLLPGKKLH